MLPFLHGQGSPSSVKLEKLPEVMAGILNPNIFDSKAYHFSTTAP